MKKQVSALVVVNDNDEVLILQRSKKGSWPGRWNFPGGTVDPDDKTNKHAAARETMEEAAVFVDPEVLTKLGTINYPSYDLHFFITDEYEGDVEINDESNAYKWVEISSLSDFKFPGGNISPDLVRRIRNYVEV